MIFEQIRTTDRKYFVFLLHKVGNIASKHK